MTATQTLRRTLIVGLASFTIALILACPASAGTPLMPNDVVIASSTVLGSDSFTMTATNLGHLAVDLDLAAPGTVSGVNVDYGSFDGRWTISALTAGATATMTGTLLS